MNVNSTIAAGEQVADILKFSTGQVTSTDGTIIGYRQIGQGPGLIIMHGGARASQHYLHLAQELAGTCSVYIPDRRGRGLSGLPGQAYNIEKEFEDLSALMQKTSSRMLFGHSAGGFFALEAALKLPVEKLVLYEPPVPINGSLDYRWTPAFERALARGDSAVALAIFFKGLRLHWTGRLPVWVLAAFSRLMMRTQDGREMAELLPTIVWEIEEIRRLDQAGLTYERYQNIQAETLLLGGSRSPDYLRKVLPVLADVIPQACMLEFPGFGHNAPDQDAPEVVAAEIRKFLS
jgi:pimeloyl-ACP methyl ester carboxylesterase